MVLADGRHHRALEIGDDFTPVFLMLAVDTPHWGAPAASEFHHLTERRGLPLIIVLQRHGTFQ
ncbi:MAG: hypothetical protein CTY25_08815 [Methylobacterium sp.]|nr:MAG: hypothetical protein CTY25_08815 [Methylobacterium sp.]